MIELIAPLGTCVSVLSVGFYLKHEIKARQEAAEQFLTDVRQRKASLWELEKKNKCDHLEWEEVAVEKTGEMVAYLCLNPKCTEPLYPDEWNPVGCHCVVAEEKYKVSCVVSYHSGKAKLAEAMKPKSKPKPVVAKSPACGCNEFATRTFAMLKKLQVSGVLSVTQFEGIYRAMTLLHPKVHAQGTHYRDLEGLDLWLYAGEQIVRRPGEIRTRDFLAVVDHIIRQVAELSRTPLPTSYYAQDWDQEQYTISNGWGNEITRFSSGGHVTNKSTLESLGKEYLRKMKKGY